jgi:hypothetical protein
MDLAVGVFLQDASGSRKLGARRMGGRRGATYFVLFGFLKPGASDLALSTSPVVLSFFLSPGEFPDLPGSGLGLCPGALCDAPKFGVPLLPAWTMPTLIVAKTSNAAQIAIFLRVMLAPSVALIVSESAGRSPASSDYSDR